VGLCHEKSASQEALRLGLVVTPPNRHTDESRYPVSLQYHRNKPLDSVSDRKGLHRGNIRESTE
jgi:hypothetical protein